MDPALFRRLIPEVRPLADLVYLHVMGEALLHPDFQELTAFAGKQNVPLGMTTNGSLFETPNAEALFSGAFRQINISMHAADEIAEYDAIFSFLRQAIRKTPSTFLNLRLWDTGTSDRQRILKEIGTAFSCEVPADIPHGRESCRLCSRLYVHFDLSFEWPDFSLPLQAGTGCCMGGVRQFAVLCDGTVTPCCLDADGQIPLGNASSDSLAHILGASRAERLRNGFLRHQVLEPLCLHCSYRLRFDKEFASAREGSNSVSGSCE